MKIWSFFVGLIVVINALKVWKHESWVLVPVHGSTIPSHPHRAHHTGSLSLLLSLFYLFQPRNLVSLPLEELLDRVISLWLWVLEGVLDLLERWCQFGVVVVHNHPWEVADYNCQVSELVDVSIFSFFGLARPHLDWRNLVPIYKPRLWRVFDGAVKLSIETFLFGFQDLHDLRFFRLESLGFSVVWKRDVLFDNLVFYAWPVEIPLGLAVDLATVNDNSPYRALFLHAMVHWRDHRILAMPPGVLPGWKVVGRVDSKLRWLPALWGISH